MCRAGKGGGMPRPTAMRAPTEGKLQGRGATPRYNSERKHQGLHRSLRFQLVFISRNAATVVVGQA